MGQYSVSVFASPGRRYIGGRRFEAVDDRQATVRGYQAAGQIIHLRRIAKYRCTYSVFNVSPHTGLPICVAHMSYVRAESRVKVPDGEGHWLSPGQPAEPVGG